MLYVAATDQRLSYEAQLVAVEDAAGVTRIRGVTTFEDPTRSTLFEFNDAARSGHTLGLILMRARFWASFRGMKPQCALSKIPTVNFCLGEVGTEFVEFAAHWAIVMFITGI